MNSDKNNDLENQDSIVKHFLLIAVFLLDLVLTALTLLFRLDKKSKKTDSSKKLKQEWKDKLQSMSTVTLQEIASEPKVMVGVGKEELIELILSNKNSINILTIKEYEKGLMKLTKDQLKENLKGIESLSKYKKADLVQLILQRKFKQ